MAKYIDPTYADLIDGMDADAQQLVADLHAFFNPAVPSRLQALPPLTAPPAIGCKWHWPRRAVVAALAVFALVGATVAVSLLQSLWSGDRGLQHVTQAGLARDLDLRQTINGVTVHVQKGYADVNRVAIGYSIELPPTTADDGSQFTGPIRTSSAPILTDDRGNTYPSRGFATTTASPLGAEIHYFRPVGLVGARDVAFTLTIPSVDRAPRGSGAVQTFQGPWVFKFTLPMAAGRVVETTLTFTRPGVELTFTRIVVAPSATRFDYRVHLDGFTDRAGANLVLSVTGLEQRKESSSGGFSDLVDQGSAGWSSGAFCQPDTECSLVLTEPLLDGDTLHADAWIVIPDREPCPPRQRCEVGKDGKPLQIHMDNLTLPLR